MGNRHLRAVRVKNLQPVALLLQILADLREGRCRLLRQEGQGLFVAVDAVSDEIVGGIVADLQDRVRNRFGEQHEAGGIVGELHLILSLFRCRGIEASAHILQRVDDDNTVLPHPLHHKLHDVLGDCDAAAGVRLQGSHAVEENR